MAKVLITGADGQVGKSLQSIQSQYPNHQFRMTTKKDLDITDLDAINNYLDEHSTDWIVNCAAYTHVDQAEEDQEMCHLVNAIGPKYIADASKGRNIKIIHLSSDYVYHSNFGTPFKETSMTNPQSVYANCKLEGEQYILGENFQSYVLRTSWVYSEYGHNFVKTMLRLGEEKDTIDVVCDQIGVPTYALDLAQIIMKIIQSDIPFGLYNYSNSGRTSWYNFANSIFENVGISCLVRPIRTDEYPTLAQRPPYSVLDLTKIKTALQIEIRDWEDALKECLNNVTQMV